MGALPRPDLPAGPSRDLFERLHELHHVAGWPSLRTMAREVGCSHATVATLFSGGKAPRWGLLELVVETLGGDTEQFRTLWLQATTPAADPGPGPVTRPGAAQPVPRQLPADVAGFTGRRDALAELDRLLDRPANGTRIIVVSGSPGVGKTALVVHWAHRVARRFPDGQLYLNLRGYHADAPASPAEALGRLLRSLGESGRALPAAADDLAAGYRTLVAGRRLLVVLDNAGSVAQVRDLLPGDPSCVLLVTSRDALSGLVARHGAVRLELDLLPPPDAAGLLNGLIGARARADPEQVAVLARRCAHLPLALRVAAERAVSRPEATLAELADELADHRGRLDALDTGDDEAGAVRTVFSWSTRQLRPAGRAMFDLLGLYPGEDVDAAAAAALAGSTPPAAGEELAALARAHLLFPVAGGRFGRHDLLRGYAQERAGQLPAAQRAAALDRLREYHRRAAARAGQLKFGAVPDGEAAAWLDAERGNLLAVAALAEGSDPAGHVRQLSALLARYLEVGGHYPDAIRLHRAAAAEAVAAGQDAPAGAALNRLGAVYARAGDLAIALEHYTEALARCSRAGDGAGAATALQGMSVTRNRTGHHREARQTAVEALARYTELGDRSGAGEALMGIALAELQLGEYPAAIEHLQRALVEHRAAGDRTNEGRSLNNLGFLCYRTGRDAEARDCYQQARVIAGELGNRAGEAAALINVAHLDARAGRPQEALAGHRAALELCTRIGYRVGEAEALLGLGVVCTRLGRLPDAVGHLSQALAVSRRLHDPDMETGALDGLGRALRAAGRLPDALRRHSEASRVATAAGDPFAQARALAGLAEVLAAAGQPAAAAGHRARAEALYERIGVPQPARD